MVFCEPPNATGSKLVLGDFGSRKFKMFCSFSKIQNDESNKTN